VDSGAQFAVYALGVDGISLPLILLTAFMTVPVIIAGWSVIEKRPAQYFAAFLIMEGLMIGVFARSIRCCSTSSGKRC
jgi:NADH-quinone oxidoreductase subunit M